MNAIAKRPAVLSVPGSLPFNRKEQFRLRFQRSLHHCVCHGFSVEEAFGLIWEETWEEIALTEREEKELYEELIHWAKKEAFGRSY